MRARSCSAVVRGFFLSCRRPSSALVTDTAATVLGGLHFRLAYRVNVSETITGAEPTTSRTWPWSTCLAVPVTSLCPAAVMMG